MNSPVSKQSALKHYEWATGCEGWNLVDTTGLSVKQELMAPGTAEAWHYHKQAQQFFYILEGIATIQTDDEEAELIAGVGLHIPAGQRHRILNQGATALQFILCSQPSTLNDRINCDDE